MLRKSSLPVMTRQRATKLGFEPPRIRTTAEVFTDCAGRHPLGVRIDGTDYPAPGYISDPIVLQAWIRKATQHQEKRWRDRAESQAARDTVILGALTSAIFAVVSLYGSTDAASHAAALKSLATLFFVALAVASIVGGVAVGTHKRWKRSLQDAELLGEVIEHYQRSATS